MTESYSLTLPSNNGWCDTSWELNDVVEIENRRFINTKVVFNSRFWNRAKFMRKDINSLDLIEDCLLTLPQILLVERELEKLHTHLGNWLQTPINQIDETPLSVTADLTSFTDSQLFEMSFGNTENRVVPRGQTECTISYEASAISGEFSYIVDQSCIREFVEGLAKYFSTRKQA